MSQLATSQQFLKQLGPITDPFSERSAARALPKTAGPAPLPEIAGLDFEIVTTPEGFQALEADWSSLLERAAGQVQAFQTHAWHWHWLNHYGATGPSSEPALRLCILVTRRGGRVVAIWPLVMERAAFLKIVSWMGEPVSQYGDVIVEAGPETAAILSAGWAHLTTSLRCHVYKLRKVRADSAIAPLLAALSFETTAIEEAPYVDLTGPDKVHAHEERLSPRGRRNRRQLARRLAEQGPIAVEVHQRGPVAAQHARDAIAEKSKRLAEKGQYARAYSDGRMADLFADVCGPRARSAGGWITTLSCGEKIASTMIGLVHRRWLSIHVLVHSADLEKCAPGLVHIEETIRSLQASGFERLDLLAPRHDYKMEWADGVVEVRDYALANGLVGWIYVDIFQRRLRALAKRWLPRLPEGMRNLLRGLHGRSRRAA